MRILFLLTQDLESPSGLGRYRPMALGLSRLGHQVQIAALHPNLPSIENTIQQLEQVQVKYVAPMHVIKQGNRKEYYGPARLAGIAVQAIWGLSLAALQSPVDLIFVGKPHPMNGIAGLLGSFVRKASFYLDCDDFEAASGRFGSGWQKNGVEYFEKELPKLARQVTTNTITTRDRLVSWGVETKKILYLPNGVERSRFLPPASDELERLRGELGLEGKKVISFIGSMSIPSHPVDLLLRAFRSVLAAEPGAILLLVGGGEDYDRLQGMTGEMGIAGSVRFCGRVPAQRVNLYYRISHVSVDPVYDDEAARSRSPLKLFESWACGTPFVTAAVGDRVPLAGKVGAASLAEPGQPESLAREILRVLTSPGLAGQLAQSGSQQVEAFYWDQLVLQLDAFIQGDGANN